MVTHDDIVRGLEAQYGVSRENAQRAADRTLQTRAHGGAAISVAVDPRMPRNVFALKGPQEAVGVDIRQDAVLDRFHRKGDALELRLVLPPRTKKNGTMLGIRQTPAYRRYRDAIIAAIAPLKATIGLPLPDREYNIAATYYVDRRGEPADKCGLDQGLYDALENAGVVSNDWFFRRADGTRIVLGDSRPRVELTITPIEEEQHAG